MSFHTSRFSLFIKAALAVCLVLPGSAAMANDPEYKNG